MSEKLKIATVVSEPRPHLVWWNEGMGEWVRFENPEPAHLFAAVGMMRDVCNSLAEANPDYADSWVDDMQDRARSALAAAKPPEETPQGVDTMTAEDEWVEDDRRREP